MSPTDDCSPGVGFGNGGQVAIAAPLTSGGHPNSNAPGRRKEDDVNIVVAPALVKRYGKGTDSDASDASDALIAEPTAVRRLTPVECERLQGFPDNWTQLGDTPDSPRYSAMGDAVTVNVAHWIGERLAAFHTAPTSAGASQPATEGVIPSAPQSAPVATP